MIELERLPIFPLSNVVLFPRVVAPLHLFEPRYRQLAQEVLAGDGRLAMAVVRPEHLDDMRGNPPIYPVGCAGVITASERLPDGRYNIVLLGEYRVRIVEETPPDGTHLYRVARAQRLEDGYPDSERDGVARVRAAIVEQVGGLLQRAQPDRSDAIDPELFAGLDDETFVNAVCHALAFSASEKQGLLEAGSIPERYARLESTLSFQRFELEHGTGSNLHSLH